MDLAIPTISKFDLLEVCIRSAMGGTVKPKRIFVIDNSSGKLQEQEWLDDFHNLIICTPPHNLGVAGSWNFFINHNEDDVVICNDDVKFQSDTFEVFVEGVKQNPTGGIFYCDDKYQGSEYSCFLVRRWVFDEIGPFDEQFYPAYFEDNDFNYRAKLAEVPIIRLSDLRFGHVGSATLKGYSPADLEKHHQEFRKNRERYVRKWGGEPGKEVCTAPYAGVGPQMPEARTFEIIKEL